MRRVRASAAFRALRASFHRSRRGITSSLPLLLLVLWFTASCDSEGQTGKPSPGYSRPEATQSDIPPVTDDSVPTGADTAISLRVDASAVQRALTRQVMGQAVWYSWQAYAWDYERQQVSGAGLPAFVNLGMGIVGHYPGVGVITHDFHWENVIGPLEQRSDPTPNHHNFDTARHLTFGPDEYGKLLEQYRQAVDWTVEGSIQVNIVNGTAEEAADWVEYMNSPNDGANPGGGTDWAALRAHNGHPEPYGVHYWELGNEPHFTASRIGHLTADEYVARIREFVPLMKQRDPSIEVMAYVNPFAVGDPDLIGAATADLMTESGATWTQIVIRDAGDLLDYVYFHWYGGWNDRRNEYQYLVTSMYTGLIPLLDRLQSDVEQFAPTDEARQRLSRIMIPEWNVYGGWFRPVAKGTALQGALAYSRTIHVFAQRSDVYGAQHLGLVAPYPRPVDRPIATDIRDGYFTLRTDEEGNEFMGTALAAVGELWSAAFQPNVLPRLPHGRTVDWRRCTRPRRDCSRFA